MSSLSEVLPRKVCSSTGRITTSGSRPDPRVEFVDLARYRGPRALVDESGLDGEGQHRTKEDETFVVDPSKVSEQLLRQELCLDRQHGVPLLLTPGAGDAVALKPLSEPV